MKFNVDIVEKFYIPLTVEADSKDEAYEIAESMASTIDTLEDYEEYGRDIIVYDGYEE